MNEFIVKTIFQKNEKKNEMINCVEKFGYKKGAVETPVLSTYIGIK